MKKPLLGVKDIIQITGITARTLHYYDRIDLLKPTHLTEKGYRLYDRSSLEKLQMILFLKELDFSLKEIADIVKLTRKEQQHILNEQRHVVQSRIQQLESIKTAIEEYVSGKDIGSLQIFNHSSVLPLQEQYANEASFFYGETEAYKEYNERLEQLPADERGELFSRVEQVFKQMASHMNASPASDEVQRLIREWRESLEHLMTCDSNLLTCIADTYKYDRRMRDYLNQYGEDFADFLHSAIMQYISPS
ncbi:MerR family transcriptional regulator [Paenibacillus sp. FSL M8-0334]|uniref:MerR family transcriptional regulator n=1 Tax=Paenibacillus campinasensis TaxID=66347 RepID=A0ABW9SZ78_9BACL|nr:MerR family transcriptional regulator [Paenibacillus campinasensis]MUG65772.1 MerR family transcriptional regulator [Paenibacillus campinasensis]